MKTIFKRITLAVACIAGLSSCNDFLTTEPHDFLAPETFYTNYSNCEMALAGVYSALTKEAFYGNFYIVDHCLGNDHTYYQRGTSTTNTKPMKENKYNFTSLIENASSEKESVKRMISQVIG